MKFRIITLGCKVNQYESQKMADLLCEHGHSPALGDESCDIAIVNSCTVTATADQKTRQSVRRLRRENPGAIICLTGCWPQAFPEKGASFEAADIVIGNSNRERLPELIEQFAATHTHCANIVEHSVSSGLSGCVCGFGERSRAFIKIEDGCNRFCSYCIIPYARGRVRSRSIDDVIAELKALDGHYREIVFTGINLTAFGTDTGCDLGDMVHEAAKIDGIERIRLGSLEPDHMTPTLLDKLAAEPKFCPQFHISLQSGCTETLKRMNRHYSADEYAALVASINERFENPAVTTDVMVGFPGETQDEFERSLEFVKSIGFLKVHCFIYSRRSGTIAASMPDQVPESVKKERSERLIAACDAATETFHNAQCGIEAEVLVEREIAPNVFEGYSRNYTPFLLHTFGLERGETVRCIPNRSDLDHCHASNIISK